MNPKFSVIVPVFNCAKYINRCLDSICNQSYDNFEVIVIDDGSSDTTPQILASYSAVKNVQVIHIVNSGVVAARKKGVELAAGQYLVFVDSDDWIDKDYLLAFSEEIASNDDPDLVCSGYQIEGKLQEQRYMNYPEGFYARDRIEKDIFPSLIQTKEASYFAPSLWAKAIKSELYRKNEFTDSRVKIGEDGACVIACVANASSLVISGMTSYHYYVNNESATKSRKVFSWDGPRFITKFLKEKIDFKSFDFQEQLYRKIVHEVFSVVVSQFNQQRNFFAIRSEILHNINQGIYKEAISCCMFSHLPKTDMMVIALRWKLFFLILVYNKLKK